MLRVRAEEVRRPLPQQALCISFRLGIFRAFNLPPYPADSLPHLPLSAFNLYLYFLCFYFLREATGLLVLLNPYSSMGRTACLQARAPRTLGRHQHVSSSLTKVQLITQTSGVGQVRDVRFSALAHGAALKPPRAGPRGRAESHRPEQLADLGVPRDPRGRFSLTPASPQGTE